ncbi:SGNH/GDSL hydrolase family protein [Vibrio sp. ZSDE26]|uniref:SGNH/GDSL hydrolase family protein n=1 Tax=Vibrio amylolyticus TaxID=2847292 RepID=A0A9X1XMK9_9VIBR|nr:SGNH/GDSL hydrolase family protein [Vibrio amylolyticus]MCK6265682.1 SGNH/GDSL hydrolase family protein [Vibrio amylolyticus]
MKTILCFGDSNTWGYDPSQPRRFNTNERWTMRLQSNLDADYRIIEEGQNGRTTVFEDPFEIGKRGVDYLLPCLESHHPDLVIILLGTNDLQTRFGVTAHDIAKGAARLVQIVQQFHHGFMHKPAEVLLVSPPPVLEVGPFKDSFVDAEEKSKQLAHYYEQQASELGCHFLNAGDVIKTCDQEGVHWNKEEHAKLAKALAELIPSILPAA